MATTVAVSPSEYLQPSNVSIQDHQPSPLALLAATCSKIGPPAAQAPVTSPPAQPQPRRLLPIKPAPIAPAPPKNLGFLSAKGNVIQLPAGLGSSAPGSPIVLTIQQSPARSNNSAPANIQYQMMPQIQGAQTIQMMPQGGQIQLIPGTNQAIITTPMTVPSQNAANTPITPQKSLAIKPSPRSRKSNNSHVVQLPGGITLPLSVATGEMGGTQFITETAAAPAKGRRGRKKKIVLNAYAPPPAQPPSPTSEMETILIEAGDNIIQAGNNLLIVQSPGQPAMVQQVQLVQSKPESQVVQIPQQALKVVQAASATLPTIPQRHSAPSSLQVTQSEPTPTQFLFKTASGEWQTVHLQDSVSTSSTQTTAVVTNSPPQASIKRTLQGGKKERTLAKIAPAGGMISLNTSQLTSATQAVQTISINGVQVQGVPVTITNAGVQAIQGGGLQLATSPGQPALQMEQTLTLELPGQQGEKKRRMACTCPNCKDAEKRYGTAELCLHHVVLVAQLVKACTTECYQLLHLGLLLKRMVFLMTPEHQSSFQDARHRVETDIISLAQKALTDWQNGGYKLGQVDKMNTVLRPLLAVVRVQTSPEDQCVLSALRVLTQLWLRMSPEQALLCVDAVSQPCADQLTLAALEFLSSLGKIFVPSDSQSQILPRLSGLFGAMLSDRSWPLHQHALEAFSHFAEITNHEEVISQSLCVEETKVKVVNYLSKTVNAREHVESRLQRIKLEKAVIEKHNERLESDKENASDRLTAEAGADSESLPLPLPPPPLPSHATIQHSLSLNDAFLRALPHAAPSPMDAPPSRQAPPPMLCALRRSEASNFTASLRELEKCGWYWGPMNWEDAEMKLKGKPDGSFLVRDSSDPRYILSLSFRSQGVTHHTRMEHYRGTFSLWCHPKFEDRCHSVVEFIERAIMHSKNGKFLYFLRSRVPGLPPTPVQLLYPVSRFSNVKSLQHLCRFCIRQMVRIDHIQELPLPRPLISYLSKFYYYDPEEETYLSIKSVRRAGGGQEAESQT
ncbi:hypothetical protein JOQ06_012975 [Pogonophryne albipinna]|uniref:Suppressor of cytokine signaling 7 n=1 Tax=Pogonophryne albipinna TaxID=1090488 RepID=A0AAD6BKD4_9TELE|nr:hypothetical protein JOQ06_012975 [Pogonophryne albipinna]